MMKKNNIVIISNTSWLVYNHRRSLIKYLKEQGYSIHVIAKLDAFSKALECNYHSISIESKGTNLFKDFKLIVDLYKLFKIIKPSVTINFTIKMIVYGAFVAKLNKVNIITNLGGRGFMGENSYLLSK